MRASETSPAGAHGSGFGRVTSIGVPIGVTAAVIAGATIRLMLTDPLTVITALDEGEVTPLVLTLAEFVYDAIVGWLAYL